MTQEQFDAWLPEAIAGYAAEHVASGRWAEDEALEKSREEHATLLPQGPATPGHHLWSIVRSKDHEPVGLLWLGVIPKPPSGWIYNIEIFPPFRRRGYAEAAMLELEREVRRLGLGAIGLHVFAANSAARPLYEKLGYEPTNVIMSKRLT